MGGGKTLVPDHRESEKAPLGPRWQRDEDVAQITFFFPTCLNMAIAIFVYHLSLDSEKNLESP